MAIGMPTPSASRGPVYEDFKPRLYLLHESLWLTLRIDLPAFLRGKTKVETSGDNKIIVSGETRIGGNRIVRFRVNHKAPHNSDLSEIITNYVFGTLIIIIPKQDFGLNASLPLRLRSRLRPQPLLLADPESGTSFICIACTLPIFSTPFVSHDDGDQLFLHHQCASLPEKLMHELHPHHTLLLVNQLQLPTPYSITTCQNCNLVCGTMFYQCPDICCDFRLDLLCAWQIKIVHRSHAHSLMAIRLRDSASLTCNACDNTHKWESYYTSESANIVTVSYLCNPCGFWIHPDCASLPNPILHYEHHPHSLFLTYNFPTSTSDKCLICSEIPKKSSGVYFCPNCPNYLVHIRCALKRSKIFKPVFIRDAQAADLGILPLPDERTSLVPYLRENASAATSSYRKNLHPHTLIFHEADDCSSSSTVCNACIQLISPPFFSCSVCPDFFLHSCCANLPIEIKHRAHHEEHLLVLSPKAPNSDISGAFSCKGCQLRCNGFVYSCKLCDDFTLDVICALITPAVTHEPHNKTHILFMCRNMIFDDDERCHCCNSRLNGICYECSICHNFKLHARCALLPNTVGHKFDQHPLQLTIDSRKISTTAVDDEDVCEVCEEHLKKDRWYYSCNECNSSFHVDCIPSVDHLSRIKLGSSLYVEGHDCPLTLTRRGDDGCGGLRCEICKKKFKYSDEGLAYECCKCFTRIHYRCVENVC